MRRFASCLAGMAMMLAGVAGCGESGPAKYSVAGFVTYEGQPVEKGEISFVPAEGGAPDGGTIEKGKFSFRTTKGKKL